MSCLSVRWYVYFAQGCDGSVYTGCSTNPVKRVHQHNNTKKGARFLRSRRPVTLLWSAIVPDGKVAAHRVEYWLKRHSAAWKRELIMRTAKDEEWGTGTSPAPFRTEKTTNENDKMSKKDKKSNKPHYATKVPKSATASTMHLVGHDCEFQLREGIRSGSRNGETNFVANFVAAGPFGAQVAFSRFSSTRTNFVPWAAIFEIRRKVASAKDEQVEKIPWAVDTKAAPEVAGLVGEWCLLRVQDGGMVEAEQSVVFGTVDHAGVGCVYDAYGSTYVSFRSSTSIIYIGTKEKVDDGEE